jgi:hypothetical protein
MVGRYSDCPVTNLKKRDEGLYGRKETWVDRVVQYIFFLVLGAFGMLVYAKYVGLP